MPVQILNKLALGTSPFFDIVGTGAAEHVQLWVNGYRPHRFFVMCERAARSAGG
jgi:hypothetical protein